MLCHVGDSGKIVIFAIFAKFAIMFSFLPFLFLRAFLDISQEDSLLTLLIEADGQSNDSSLGDERKINFMIQTT